MLPRDNYPEKLKKWFTEWLEFFSKTAKDDTIGRSLYIGATANKGDLEISLDR